MSIHECSRDASPASPSLSPAIPYLPSFLQVEPWKTHIWQDGKLRPRRREIRLRVLVKYVEAGSVAVCTVSLSHKQPPCVRHGGQGVWRTFFMVLAPRTLDTNSETHLFLLP